jgi:hypothetical protein
MRVEIGARQRTVVHRRRLGEHRPIEKRDLQSQRQRAVHAQITVVVSVDVHDLEVPPQLMQMAVEQTGADVRIVKLDRESGEQLGPFYDYAASRARKANAPRLNTNGPRSQVKPPRVYPNAARSRAKVPRRQRQLPNREANDTKTQLHAVPLEAKHREWKANVARSESNAIRHDTNATEHNTNVAKSAVKLTRWQANGSCRKANVPFHKTEAALHNTNAARYDPKGTRDNTNGTRHAKSRLYCDRNACATHARRSRGVRAGPGSGGGHGPRDPGFALVRLMPVLGLPSDGHRVPQKSAQLLDRELLPFGGQGSQSSLLRRALEAKPTASKSFR